VDLSCEIARIFTRDFHLTTGTFNLVVKEPIRFRLSGALSVQSRDTQVRLCLSSKLVQVTGSVGPCQPGLLTGFAQKSSQLSAVSFQQNGHATELIFRTLQMPDFRHEPTRKMLVKLKILNEVLATYAQTLRGTLSPNMTPWPGRNCSVTDQMPDERRKTRIKRPASHTTLDGSFLIPRGVERLQEGVY